MSDVQEPAVEPEMAPAEGAEGAPEAPPEVDPTQQYLQADAQRRQLEREALKLRKQLKEREGYLSEQDYFARLKEDPLATLQAAGLPFDELAARALQTEAPTQEERENAELRARVERMEQERQQERETLQHEQYTAQQRQVLNSIQGSLDERPDLAYSAITGGSGELFQRMSEYASEYGESPDTETQEEIAQDIEAKRRTLVDTQVDTLLERSPEFRDRLRAKLAAAESSETSGPEATPGQQPPKRGKAPGNAAKPKTLTSNLRTSVESRSSSPMTREERRRRALDKLG